MPHGSWGSRLMRSKDGPRRPASRRTVLCSSVPTVSSAGVWPPRDMPQRPTHNCCGTFSTRSCADNTRSPWSAGRMLSGTDPDSVSGRVAPGSNRTRTRLEATLRRFGAQERRRIMDFGSDPYPEYALLRAEEPVRRILEGRGLYGLLVTRYEDVRMLRSDPAMSKDPRNAPLDWQEAGKGRPLEDRTGLGTHLLTTDAPEHTRLRRLG